VTGSGSASAPVTGSGSDAASAPAFGAAADRPPGAVVEPAGEAALDSGPTATGTGGTGEIGGSSAGSRPRGKGRTGRIESIADAWTDGLRRASSRALPLPPPKQAENAAAGSEADEDEDDFTIVDPEKTPRSFETTPAPVAVAASQNPDARAAATDLAAELVDAPILSGRRPRRLWLAGLGGAGAAALLVALLIAMPGRDTAPARGKAAPERRQPAPRAIPALSAAKLAESEPRPTAKAQPAPRPEARTRGAASAARSESRAAERGKPPARKARRRLADPDELYSAGARLYLDGKLDQARRKFQAALALAPRFAPGHRGLGLVYERMGQTDRAIRSWQAYLRIKPEAADAKIIRARLRRLSQ
jgi:hypothetical protein